MKVLILAAGYGTRLYAITKDKPKALLDINGRPLIEYVLDKIKGLNGLNEVILVTNEKFYTIFQDWAKSLKDFPYPIKIINDGTKSPEDRLGSIGDIDFVLKKYPIKDDVFVLGSDNLFDYSLADYVRFAQNQPEAVSIGLYDIHNKEEAKKFGVVAVDQNRKVTSFEEKPSEPKSTLVSMCSYYLPVKTLGLIRQYLDESKKSDTSGDYVRWLYQKNNVFGFKFDGKWYDIGSVESYHEAQSKFK
jgi:glucose-1-phosphate thymidylyltransferase